MNSLKKRLISLVLLTCVALSSFAGCSKDNNSSSKKNSSESEKVQDDTTQTTTSSEETSPTEKTTTAPILDIPLEYVTNKDGEPIGFPLQSAEIGNKNSGESNNNGIDLSGPDPDSIDVSPSLPSGGQPTTQVVEVTNAQGEKETDSAGNQVTEYVTSPNTGGSASDYKSVTSGNFIFWMDVLKMEDFVFNDEFIKITFEVKEGIPDGEYPITFATDLSSYNGISVKPSKIYSGSVTVGGEAKKGEDISGETDFIIYGDHVSCKQGESVDFYIKANNNPGMAAMILWFYYDSNAMTVKTRGVKAAGEFAEISKRIETDV